MKRFFAAMLVAVMLVAMIPAVSSAATYATVVGGWLRLRANASFNANTITSYYTGTSVEVLGQSGKWYHVRTPDGRTGYMYGDYLKVGGYTPSGTNAWVTSHNGYGVRLRQGPSTSYRTIRTYAVGTPVTVLQTGSYWCKLNIGGTIGYMMTQFLQFDGYQPDPSEPVIGYANIWSSNGYGVRLRTGPGKGYSKIGVYSVGTTVAILQKGPVWDRIRVGGRVGYMMNEFLRYQNNNEVTSVALNTLTPSVGTVMSVQAITPSSATVAYEWLVGGVVKATSSTYTVTSADVGKAIQLRVTGTGSYRGTVLSALTNEVVSNTQLTNVQLSTTAPVVGNTLTATITPADATVVYAWKVDGYQVSNQASYTTTANDVGKKVTLIVTGTGSYHGTVSATTSEVAASANVTDVSIVNESSSSVTSVGDKLIAKLSPTQATVSYQWNRDGGEIAGATGSTYILTDADEGKKITVTVKGIGAYAGEKTSLPTDTIQPKPTAPTIDVIGLPEGTVGKLYSTRLNAQGGGTITWKLVDGSSLPGGLDLGTDGTISGTPTTEGSVTFYVVASNAAGSSAPQSFTINVKKDVAPATYTLTIKDGKTFENLAGDATVNIVAAEPAEGKRFDKWTLVSGSGSFGSETAQSTTFLMNNSNAVIEAVYADAGSTDPDPEPKPETKYTLTIEGGKTFENLVAGTQVNIVAADPEAGKVFTGWTLVEGSGTFADQSAQSTMFTMGESNAVIRATYSDPSAPEPDPEYTITVEGGASYTGKEGTSIDLGAPSVDGKQFTGWEKVSGEGSFEDTASANTKFYIGKGDATVRANYTDASTPDPEPQPEPEKIRYSLVVEGGKTYTVKEGSRVELHAPDPAEGKQFVRWEKVSGEGGFEGDPSNRMVYFIVSTSDATVRPVYEDIPAPATYKLTVENGSGSTEGIESGEMVTITANAAGANEKFVGWTLVSGSGSFGDESSAQTTFLIAGSDTVVKANYEKVAVKLATPSVTWDPSGTSVSWSSVDGAVEYEFYRYKASADANTNPQTQTSTNYTFQSPGTTGDILYVRAIGDGVTTLNSDWGQATY